MQLLGESNFEIYSRYFSQYGWYWYGNTDSNITLLTSKSSSLTYAMCRFCNRLFMISRNIKNMKEVICPNCGKTHKKEGYVYSAKSETIFPLNASMKLYEMKDKLELRIKYIGLLWNETPAPNYEKIYGLKEKFVFDIKNHSCTWQKGRPYWDREKKKISPIAYQHQSRLQLGFQQVHQLTSPKPQLVQHHFVHYLFQPYS